MHLLQLRFLCMHASCLVRTSIGRVTGESHEQRGEGQVSEISLSGGSTETHVI